MSTFIDFEAVKAANPIGDVAERLGLNLKKAGNQLRGPCPSGEGGERAFVITPAKAVWYSFGLQQGGDVLALVELVNECSTKEAAHFLAGETVPPERRNKRQSKESAETRGGFRALDYLEPDHVAVEALGIESEDAKALGIGYAPRGVLRGSVAVPVRLSDGTISGYIGITEAKLPPKWEL
ncbi:MAG: CHC2 zinc finger domain-containing protein [Paracoccaceae bacterium]